MIFAVFDMSFLVQWNCEGYSKSMVSVLFYLSTKVHRNKYTVFFYVIPIFFTRLFLRFMRFLMPSAKNMFSCM